MSKAKQKELSFSEIGVLCLIMSALSTTFFSLPMYGLLFNICGFGSIGYDIVDRKNRKHDKWFKARGLNVDDHYPRLLEKKETSYGTRLKFIKPKAITSEDFQKHATALNEYFGDGQGEVVVNYKNGFVFVELHNKVLKTMYDLRNIEQDDLETKKPLELILGETFDNIATVNIPECPHILIAGRSGGGKSNLVNLIITYLLRYKAKKHNIEMHLMDFKKGVELGRYAKHPNVKSLSIEIEEAMEIFYYIENEMNRRYELFKKAELKDFESYNKRFPKNKLHPIVIVVDEFSAFHTNKVKEAFEILEMLVNMIRAAGIFMIIATQRPDKDVVTGKIKEGVATRICFQTSGTTNSQIILDEGGAEKLRGNGHCLLKHMGKITELQTYFIDEDYSKQLINESIAEIKGESPEVAVTKTNNISNRKRPSEKLFLSKNEGGEGVKTADTDKPKTTPLPKQNIVIPKAFKDLLGVDFLDEE